MHDDQTSPFETGWTHRPPHIDDLFATVFGISPSQRRTLEAVIDMPGSTVSELATELDRDRSTITRSLGPLQEKGLIIREQRLLSGGGTIYQYFPAPAPEIQSRLQRALDDWTGACHELLAETLTDR